jgi:hypothetical protein
MRDEGRDRFHQLDEYREWALLAREQTGKPIHTQWREIVALRNCGGRCGITDYYWYKLYDDDYLKGRGRADFLGWRLLEEFSLALNPRHAVLPALDKVLFTEIALASGLPVAPVRACFHRADRLSPALGLHLRSKDMAGSFLRDPSIYPLFGKPAFSQMGYGAAYLAGYDRQSDTLKLLDGSTVAVDTFLERLDHTVDHRYHKAECGYLFQDPLKLAPEIETFSAWPALCGARVICLNGPEGVRPIRATWKIAVPPNHTDNFVLGANGNLLASIDLATGDVSTMIDGFWPRTRVFPKHPLSGQPVGGFRLPGWSQVLETCRRGGAVFPLMRIHHWDFAFTDQGPLILELNDIGGTRIPQLHGHGLLTEEVRAFLKRHANPQTHSWIKAL